MIRLTVQCELVTGRKAKQDFLKRRSMGIPDYQSIMLPLLKLASDKKEHLMQETIEKLAVNFNLSESDRRELLPSGQQEIFDNRVGWARTYLKKAGLIDSPKRGVFIITEKGQKVLQSNPQKINVSFLRQYPEFVEFQMVKKDSKELEDGEASVQQTPEESLEYGYQKLRQALAQDLLSKIKSCSPAFFEKLVVELLVKMGYYNTSLNSDHWLRWKNVVKSPKIGGQNEEAEDLS